MLLSRPHKSSWHERMQKGNRREKGSAKRSCEAEGTLTYDIVANKHCHPNSLVIAAVIPTSMHK